MANSGNHQNEQAENNLSTKDFLIGAIIGGAIGAAAALFFTPKAGKDLRQNLTHQAYTLKEKTSHLRDAAVSKGTELAGVAKEKSTSLGQAVSKQSSELMNKVKSFKPQANENEEQEFAEADTMGSNSDIQRKLEETKRAFDETELQLNQ